MGTFLVVAMLSGLLFILYKEFLKEGGLSVVICEFGFHKFDSWKYTNDVNCEKHKACSVCGKFSADPESKIEHAWLLTYLHDNSCDQQEVCVHCKDRRGEVTVAHTWQEFFIGENSNKKTRQCKRCSAQTPAAISQPKWLWIFENGNKRNDFLELQSALQRLSLSSDMFSISNNSRDDQVIIVSSCLPQTNLSVSGLKIGNTSFMFYPDGVYTFHGQETSVAAITTYSALSLRNSRIRVENMSAPNDAEIVGRTWLHSRKDGGPDLRYSHNPSIAVISYALLSFIAVQQGEVQIAVSNNQISQRFYEALISYRRSYLAWQDKGEYYQESFYSNDSQTRQGESGSSRRSNNSGKTAGSGFSGSLTLEASYELLGIRADASREEIRRAYLELVQKYHPDKVFHLADEFKAIAEERMKELNAAYELLKGTDRYH